MSATQKGTKKVTAVGTKLPWLAFRRTGSKLACPRHAQTVPPLAPDAAPSSRSFSQCGSSPRRGAFLLSATQKGTKKVTAVGTKLPWLAFRRSQDKLARLWRTQTVSCSAPDASPSLRSLSQDRFSPRRGGVPFCLPHKKEPKKSPRWERSYLG